MGTTFHQIKKQEIIMKICFTTYIYGDTYQDYIPLILYSVARSYPEYSIIIFINGNLRKDIQKALSIIDKFYDKYSIIENTFDDCPMMRSLQAQTFRWVVWDDRFYDFDYLYYIDSDILYVREPIPLHEQHIRHMQFIGSDKVSNIARKTYLKNNLTQLARTALYTGPFNTFKYLFTPYAMRLSGLHFVKVSTYFQDLSPAKLEKYRKSIYDRSIFKRTIYPNDEAVLYKMLEDTGCDMDVFAIQKTSTTMFGYNNPEKKEFCPHHGVHLGIFRTPVEQLADWAKAQLDSDDYKFYIQEFQRTYLADNAFHKLYPLFASKIQIAIQRMCSYYNITFNE